MSKHTREQIDRARQRADAAYDAGKEDRKYHPGERHPGETWIDVFAEELGLDVVSEKPEPGVFFYRELAVEVLDNGNVYTIGDGTRTKISNGDTSLALTPARVVAAEPPVLASTTSISDEARMQEDASVEWAAYRKDYGPSRNDTSTAHKAFHAGYRAALAKHGGARELPGREQLLVAICGGLARTGGWSPARGADVADKIEALYGGGGRGE